jgi:hypothetical protein
MNKGMLYKELASKGRFGDTELAHVTPEEKALLKALGGAGTINPETGLEEYWGIKSFTKPFKKAAKTVTKTASNVAGAVSDVAGGVVDVVVDAGDWVGDQVSDAVDFVVEDAPKAVSDAFASFEDGVREVVDEVDKAIQNPYVRAAVRFIPGYGQIAGAVLDTYAKLDSGEKLSAGDIANLAAAYGTTDPAGWKLTPEQTKAISTGIRVAEDPDNAIPTLIGAYGPDVVEEMGLENIAKNSLSDVIGQEGVDIISNNQDLIKTGWEIAVEGKDPAMVIAQNYGQDIVNQFATDDPQQQAVGWSALKTAVALDQGMDPSDALLAGGEEYYKRDGALPNLTQVASLVPDLDVNLGSSDFFNKYIGTFGGEAPDFSIVEDYVREYSPYIEDAARFVADAIPKVDVSGFKPVELGFDIGEWGKLKELGVDIGSLDLSDYNLPELADINLDLNLPELDLALQKAGQAPSQYASLGMDSDLTGNSFQFKLAEDEGTPLSRRLLESV